MWKYLRGGAWSLRAVHPGVVQLDHVIVWRNPLSNFRIDCASHRKKMKINSSSNDFCFPEQIILVFLLLTWDETSCQSQINWKLVSDMPTLNISPGSHNLTIRNTGTSFYLNSETLPEESSQSKKKVMLLVELLKYLVPERWVDSLSN